MAEPTVTSRVVPTGIMLKDGFSTVIAFELDPDVCLWEKTVTPPGEDGGEPIETTTMLNTLWRTFEPRKLLTLTPCEFTAGYDPLAYTQLQSLINKNGSITATLPDGSTISFYGYLQKFDIQSHEEGKMPEANCTIQPTNYDPTAHVEAGPKVVEVSGT